MIFSGNCRRSLPAAEALPLQPLSWSMVFRMEARYRPRVPLLLFVSTRTFSLPSIRHLLSAVRSSRLSPSLARTPFMGRFSSQIATAVSMQLTPFRSRSAGDEPKAYPSPVEKIEWIEAAEYYSCLHSNGRSYVLRETISSLSAKLNPGQFVRIHRSFDCQPGSDPGNLPGRSDGVVDCPHGWPKTQDEQSWPSKAS